MKIDELFEFVDKDSQFKPALDKIKNTVSGAVDSATSYVKDFTKGPEPAQNNNKIASTKFDPAVIDQELSTQGIKDPFLRNAIHGKFGQEAGSKYGTTEIPYTNTANSRIREKLPQLSGMSDAELNKLKADPKAFFNRAYGGMLANTGPDDGWNYRGRGLTGLTGKSNYAAADKALGLKGALVKDPELLAKDPDLDRRVAVWYYKNAGGDKATFKSQDEANQWAIYKAGGRAYAPGTKLAQSALADLNSRQGGKQLSGPALAKTAATVVNNPSTDVASNVTDKLGNMYSSASKYIDKLSSGDIDLSPEAIRKLKKKKGDSNVG